MKNKLKNIFPSKKVILVCQFGQDVFKAIKFLPSTNQILGSEVEIFSSDDQAAYARIVSDVLNKPDYQGLPLIICLPRYKVTFRSFKRIPAHSPKEVESIVSLQAPRMLPYPIDELISGYQIISVDQEGYSDLNMVVVHKEIVERILDAFKGQKRPGISMTASSYGLLNLYNYIRPNDTDVAMLIDADANYPEIAIIRGTNMLLSRSFRLDRSVAGWQNIFVTELDKTKKTYFKEISAQPAKKIVLFGSVKAREDLLQVLNQHEEIPVESLGYGAVKLLEKDKDMDISFASLVGLGVKRFPESLNLVPGAVKSTNVKSASRKEWVKLMLSVCAIIFVTALAIERTLENKAAYLGRLRAELTKISQEARPLEEMDSRLKAIKNRSRKSPAVLEALQELYRVIPESITLTSFSYSGADEIIIRGQTPELDMVFSFAGAIEASPVYDDFAVKVKYATKKIIATGQVCDFEIDCQRKK